MSHIQLKEARPYGDLLPREGTNRDTSSRLYQAGLVQEWPWIGDSQSTTQAAKGEYIITER